VGLKMKLNCGFMNFLTCTALLWATVYGAVLESNGVAKEVGDGFRLTETDLATIVNGTESEVAAVVAKVKHIDLADLDSFPDAAINTKRYGAHSFTAWSEQSCNSEDYITSASGFNCGYCLSWGYANVALSASLSQAFTGSPWPTATLFELQRCSGDSQSIGIENAATTGLYGCTNVQLDGGANSALVWWNC
jgi:hypothetical protein